MPRRRVIESSGEEDNVPMPSPAKKKMKRSPGAHTSKPSARTKKPATKKKQAKIEFDPKEASDVNMNESITTVLTRLGKEEAALGNRWPSISLMKASRLISKLPFKLTSGSQASVYKGIGDKIEAKIDEIIETGDCKGAHSLDAEAALEKTKELMQIYGMSSILATELVSSHGIQSIDALYSRQDLVDEKTKIGLKYFKDFKAPIPKAEADQIFSVIEKAVKQKDDKCDVILAGDFRRGAPESDEIVILLAHDQKQKSAISIQDLFAHIHSQSLFTESISSTKEKYIDVVTLSADASTAKPKAEPEMVREEPAPKAKLPLFSIPKISSTPSAPAGSVPDLFRNPDAKENVKVSSSDFDKIIHASTEGEQKHLHRRVRFQICSRSSLPVQLLYHTGPMPFWNKMQTQAASAGYVLAEKTLRMSAVEADMKASAGASPRHKVGSVVHLASEREVFEKIGQDFVEPSQRQS